MALIESADADARNYRISALLFRRIWRLTKPYWVRRGAWPAWLVYAFLCGGVVLASAATGVATYRLKTMTDALIAGQRNTFAAALVGYAGFFFLQQITPVIMNVADIWLQGNWRRWLTMHLIDQYLSKRTYYDISVEGDIDNPDQRLQENVAPFVSIIAQFPKNTLLQVGTFVTGLGILMTLGKNLVIMTLILGVIQATLSYVLANPSIGMSLRSMMAEGDLRYGLVHVRDNAEAVAFYHGEETERRRLRDRLFAAVRRYLILNYYQQTTLFGFAAIFNLAWAALPYWILSPRVFSGELTYGSVAQAVAASFVLQQSVTVLAGVFLTFAQAASQTVRLAQIQERFDESASRNDGGYARLTVNHNDSTIAMHSVSLQTPGGERSLVSNLDFCLDDGDTLAIIGQTGVGKSSLLRAMAGLWTRGEGTLDMPGAGQCLFLPQKPYMVLADLRSQLQYPYPAGLSDEELLDILDAVDLGGIVDQYGGLSAVRDWPRTLSLGEQQRIAFARILVARPRWVFLDEATSAVDPATETRLYRVLSETGAGFVSIGHRLSILEHHNRVLTLEKGGLWSIEPTGVRRGNVGGDDAA